MPHSRAHNAGFHNLLSHVDSEMLEVGLFQLFQNLGKNLIGLSIIFHMYNNLHYEAWEILIFFFFWQVPFSLTIPFVGKFIEKVGLKHALSTRAIGAIALYAGLTLIVNENIFQSILWMTPIFFFRAFVRNSSDIAYDIFLTNHLNKETKGQAVAWMQIAIMMATVIAPILGAFITARFGFNMVAICAIGFVVIAALVLYITPDQKFETPYSSKRLVSDTVFNTSRNLFIAEWGRVFFDCILWIVWPIFLAVTIKDLMSSGLLIGISSGIAMVMAFFIGKKIDKSKQGHEKILKWGAYRSSFLNFFRAIWIEPITISLIDALSKINDQTIKVPYNIAFYKWMHEENTIERAHIRWIIAQNYYTLQLAIFTGIFILFSGAPLMVFIMIFSLGAISLTLTTQITQICKVKVKA